MRESSGARTYCLANYGVRMRQRGGIGGKIIILLYIILFTHRIRRAYCRAGRTELVRASANGRFQLL